ncbi:MAG TPA: 50S ribosomal protein L29 [Thermomicrobiales bacterium]|jgi:large subunit ribosomal protein L29|nr:50S ribosomal protein L29 [Thermomicrobiales bacterium]
MKPSELRGMTEEQLEARLKELHTEWRDLRFQDAVGNLTATSRIREIRKDIARIHTIRTEQANQAVSQ